MRLLTAVLGVWSLLLFETAAGETGGGWVGIVNRGDSR